MVFFLKPFGFDGMWDFSYQTRDPTHIPEQSLNHWTARKVPRHGLL